MVDKTPQTVLTANEVTAIIERTILFGMDTLAGPEEDVAFDVSVLRGVGLISTKAGTTYSLAQADRLTLNDFTNAAGCVVTLQNETNETAWPVGTAAYIRVAAGAGSITFVADSGVTIASPGASLAAGPAGSIVKVLKSASNEYTLSGHLKFGVVVANLTENTAPDGTEELFTSADERIALNTITRYMNGVLAEFDPYDNVPPTSNFATLDTRNNHPVLDFDGATNESAVFSGRLGPQYTGNGVTVDLHVSHTSDITNDTDWDVAFERIGAGALDIDADSFAAVNSVDNTVVPGTAGFVQVISVTFTDGADMDSVAAGEQFRLKVTRDAVGDTSTTDAELHRVVVRETA